MKLRKKKIGNVSHTNKKPDSPSYQDPSVSKVEVKGFEARHYDMLMNLITLGTYPRFISRVIKDIGIEPDDDIVIFGSGTGRNACLMRRYLSRSGSILGLDIGQEMLSQATDRCRKISNVSFQRRSIADKLALDKEYDKAFTSFVLHGFVQKDREMIIDNAFGLLGQSGKLFILDYAECEPSNSSWPVRMIFNAECPLATDFVRRDWKQVLSAHGFSGYRESYYYFGHVRLLEAKKTSIV